MKNKEQFSLELWDRLKKEGIHHTFETREGSEITHLTQFNFNVKQPIVGHDTHDHNIEQWGVKGNYLANGAESGFDLFIVWEEEQLFVEGFLNIYPDRPPFAHLSRKEADIGANINRIACIPIKLPYKKGEGL